MHSSTVAATKPFKSQQVIKQNRNVLRLMASALYILLLSKMGFQSTPLAAVFPCHLQMLLKISLYKECRWSNCAGTIEGGRQMERDVWGKGAWGLCWLSLSSSMFELLWFSFVFSLSQAPPFFRIRKVLFYGGKTSPSFFCIPVVLSPWCQASPYLL